MEGILDFCLNHLGTVMAGGSGLIVAVMSIIQVSKIEINPQSWIAAQLGNALNAGVMKEIKDIKTEQEETKKKLDAHIEEGEERKADNMENFQRPFFLLLFDGSCYTEGKCTDGNADGGIVSGKRG